MGSQDPWTKRISQWRSLADGGGGHPRKWNLMTSCSTHACRRTSWSTWKTSSVNHCVRADSFQMTHSNASWMEITRPPPVPSLSKLYTLDSQRASRPLLLVLQHRLCRIPVLLPRIRFYNSNGAEIVLLFESHTAKAEPECGLPKAFPIALGSGYHYFS